MAGCRRSPDGLALSPANASRLDVQHQRKMELGRPHDTVGYHPSVDARRFRERGAATGFGFAIMFVFMLSVCAAVVSLGAGMFAWCKGRVWGLIFTTALWALAHSGWNLLGNNGHFDPYHDVVSASRPFSGVIGLTVWTGGVAAGELRLLVWVLGASSVFAALAGVLFLVALGRGMIPRATS